MLNPRSGDCCCDGNGGGCGNFGVDGPSSGFDVNDLNEERGEK